MRIVDLGIVGEGAGLTAWHVLPPGGCLDYVVPFYLKQHYKVGVRVGETVSVPKVNPTGWYGHAGLYAAPRIVDCFACIGQRDCPVASRVLLHGRVFERVHHDEHGPGRSEYVGEKRTCLWLTDAADLLLPFAYRCLRLLLARYSCGTEKFLGGSLVKKTPAREVAVSLLKKRAAGGQVPVAMLMDAGRGAGWPWLHLPPAWVVSRVVTLCSLLDLTRQNRWLENKLFERGCPRPDVPAPTL
jgi:hypothetical protein